MFALALWSHVVLLLLLLPAPVAQASRSAPVAQASRSAPVAQASRPAPVAQASRPAPVAQAGTWSRPVDGSLLRAFAVGRDPYAGGWHRGVDLAAARGSPVGSACAGRVSFAGRVPRGGLTVSVRCGPIVATYQQLASLSVHAGRDVARGARVGTVGASSDPRQRRPHLHLGARELSTGRYVDPLGLMRAGTPALPPAAPATRAPPRAVPLGPAPRLPPISPVREVRAPRVAPRLAPGLPDGAPGPAGAGTESPSGAPRGFEPGVPWLVWVGLVCVGLGLPFGGFVRVRRRRHAASRVARTA